LALHRVAAERPDPIPVFAEMSSVNPVILLSGALQERMVAIAEGLAASVTVGVGQFCTNPGLVFVPSGAAGDRFAEMLAARLSEAPAGTMLRSEIRMAYRNSVAKRASGLLREEDSGPIMAVSGSASSRLETLLAPVTEQGPGGRSAGPALFRTNVETFSAHAALADEIFGPATLLIEYGDADGLLPALKRLEGQLTATVHGTAEELRSAEPLLSVLEERAGRLIVNGFPTGVEVCSAIVHGGPFPATSDGRSSSVGTRAILRFVRPVCYQDWPEELLPDAVATANPLGIDRMVDGRHESGPGPSA
jgi:NADP-dependent aldehyde dehydrogenase